MESSDLPTPSQVREQFREDGETVTGWAKAHGFSRGAVYAVLGGRAKGDRGEAHKIAVALGIKRQPAARGAEIRKIGVSPPPSAEPLRR